MYLSLLGNLSLWSITSNASSFGKSRYVEAESLSRKARHSIKCVNYKRFVHIYRSGSRKAS